MLHLSMTPAPLRSQATGVPVTKACPLTRVSRQGGVTLIRTDIASRGQMTKVFQTSRNDKVARQGTSLIECVTPVSISLALSLSRIALS